MTLHIAVGGTRAAVMFSDSQGSTPTSEMHGWQKQVVGDDFLCGFAGRGDVIEAMQRELAGGWPEGGADRPVNAANVHATLERFIRNGMTLAARSEVEVIAVTPGPSSAPRARTLVPAVFHDFGPSGPVRAIGSGAEFVGRGFAADVRLGLLSRAEALEECFFVAGRAARQANESLTVDDVYTVGLLVDGRAYLLADARIESAYVPGCISGKAGWDPSFVATTHRELVAQVTAIDEELQVGIRAFSNCVHVGWTAADASLIENAVREVRLQLDRLRAKLLAYVAWYDSVAGREPLVLEAVTPREAS